MIDYVGAAVAVGYVLSAWKHMRVQQNERGLGVRLLHIARMLVFLSLIMLVLTAEPELWTAVFLLATLNIIVWQLDDEFAIDTGAASTNATAQMFIKLRKKK